MGRLPRSTSLPDLPEIGAFWRSPVDGGVIFRLTLGLPNARDEISEGGTGGERADRGPYVGRYRRHRATRLGGLPAGGDAVRIDRERRAGAVRQLRAALSGG